MCRVTTLFITVIQFLSLFGNTKQLHVSQTLNVVKSISKTIKNPILKQIGITIKNPIIKTFGNTIKKSLNTLCRNQNSACGLQGKFLGNVHNFGSKSVKYLGAKGIKKFKYTAPQAVRSGKHLFRTEGKKNIQMKSSTQMSGKELRSVVRRSAGQMKEKGLGSLINMVSKSKPQLLLLLFTGGLNKLTQFNLVPEDSEETSSYPKDNPVLMSAKEHLRQKIAARMRQYYQNNRDKMLKSTKEYKLNNKDKISETNKKYRLKNKDILSERYSIYYSNNREKLLKQKKEYILRNKDKISENHSKYYQNNKDKILENSKQYRLKNQDRCKEVAKAYMLKNKDEIREKNKIYQLENKDILAEKRRQYRLKNRDKINENQRERYIKRKKV